MGSGAFGIVWPTAMVLPMNVYKYTSSTDTQPLLETHGLPNAGEAEWEMERWVMELRLNLIRSYD